MALKEDLIDQMRGQSVAKYATWYYFRPERILFDAGEGVSAILRNMVYGIENVFISHGHYDHIGGLPGLVRSRASSRGDKEKPLTVYYPKGSGGVEQIRRYLVENSGMNLSFELKWVELEPGDSIELGEPHRKRRVEAFEVGHTPKRLCLGYRIVETRKRLRPEHQGLFKEEIIRIKKEQGEEALTEPYNKKLWCYSGDAMPLNPDLVRDCEVLMHDATFVTVEDREEDYHATVTEAVEVAHKAEVGALVLYHFSTRYQKMEILKEIEKSIKEIGFQAPVYFSNPYTFPNTRLQSLRREESNRQSKPRSKKKE